MNTKKTTPKPLGDDLSPENYIRVEFYLSEFLKALPISDL